MTPATNGQFAGHPDDDARLESRVLVLAPTRRDAEVTRGLLTAVGLDVFICDDVPSLAAEVRRGAACALLTDGATATATDPDEIAPLVDVLRAQPEWSELPVVMLVRGTAPEDVSRLLGGVNGATILERPVFMRTLVSTVQAAVRARARQYLVRHQLDQIRAAAADRERLLAAERDARAHAERASQAKDQFLAVLSHELRTPLTPVLATAQMMACDGALPEDVRECFGMIRRNVELEARLIDDLLDLTRVTRGKLELQPAPVDVHAKLAAVIAIVDSDLRAKRLTLVTDTAADPHHVHADPARLQQVLWNLLKNAIKFTPEGGTITVRTCNAPAAEPFLLPPSPRTRGEGRGEGSSPCVAGELARRDSGDVDGPHPSLIVEVSDTGVGIPPDVLPRLFNAFEQGGREMTRLFGGLGLGLAISKALVDAHHGSISVHSEGPNKGATFTLTLPAIPDPAPLSHSPLPHSPLPPSSSRSSIKILVVEDHPDTARAMALMLSRRGHTVRTADSVAAALSAVGSDTYDVMISDIGLPDGSGLDLMRQIRARQHAVQGIALSGFGMEEDVRRSRAAGFLAHLTKPVNIDHLEAAVRSIASSSPRAGAPA